mgnify:CR=1 FL=1
MMGIAGAVATDFNNDGHLDIVMAQSANATIIFNAGNGDGTFDEVLVTPIGAFEVLAHDVNDDGYIDIVAKGITDGEVITLYNDPAFSFSTTSTIQLGHPYFSVLRIFDIDFDGQQDLITSNESDIQYRSILSDGTFGDEETFPIGFDVLRDVVIKDAIGESFPDLVVTDGFGEIRFYTDKLNADIAITTQEKVYDGQVFEDFYETTPGELNTSVTFPGSAAPKNAGTYDVKVVVDDPTYEGELDGSLTITKKMLTVDVEDIAIGPGEDLPPYNLIFTGFVGDENASVLTELPVASSTVTPFSEQGDYEITISGGVDENYSFEYFTGVISVDIINGIDDEHNGISIFPNPAVSKIRVEAPKWTTLKLLDTTGRSLMKVGYTTEDISVGNLTVGIYIVQLQFENGATYRQRISVN